MSFQTMKKFKFSDSRANLEELPTNKSDCNLTTSSSVSGRPVTRSQSRCLTKEKQHNGMATGPEDLKTTVSPSNLLAFNPGRCVTRSLARKLVQDMKGSTLVKGTSGRIRKTVTFSQTLTTVIEFSDFYPFYSRPVTRSQSRRLVEKMESDNAEGEIGDSDEDGGSEENAAALGLGTNGLRSEQHSASQLTDLVEGGESHDDDDDVDNVGNGESRTPILIFGKHKMSILLRSPWANAKVIVVCEFCLKRLKRSSLKQHEEKCRLKHPPGTLIYKEGDFGIYEVNGALESQYCQNLCRLGLLFIEDKVVYRDVSNFDFYICTLSDDDGQHIVSYFSKLRHSEENVACLMTLPPYQKEGYGTLMIDLSYQLSILEGKVGTPERPLSSLGRHSYHAYWQWALLAALDKTNHIPIKQLSKNTGIRVEDLIPTIRTINYLAIGRSKDKYVICAHDLEKLRKDMKTPKKLINPKIIRWMPKPF